MPRNLVQRKRVYKRRAPAAKAPARRSYRSRVSSNYKKPYKYPGLGRKIGSVVGGAAGTYFGQPAIGSAIGGLVGQGAHSLVKTVTGYGDYNVSQNSLVYNHDAVPTFSNSNRCTTVTHREFVGDVFGSVNFNINSYAINPANSLLFPWLSGISENYEEYVIQGLIFEFKTTCGNAIASTNTALGTVIMATQYNTLSAPFINKQQMENYEFCQSIVPSESIMHPVECDPKLTANQGLFYVQNPNSIAVNADPRLYNIGKFSIATVGMQAANTVGELWVTYKICFLKPRLGANISGSDHYIMAAASVVAGSPWGTLSSVVLSTSSLSFAMANTTQALTALGISPWTGAAAATTCYINPNYVGDLLFVYQAHGGGATNVEPTITVAGNCILKTAPAVSAGFATYSKSYTAGGDIQITWVVTCNGGLLSGVNPATLLSGGSYASAFSFVNFAVYSIPNNLIN